MKENSMENLVAAIHNTAVEKGFWDDYLSDLKDIEFRISNARQILNTTQEAGDPALLAAVPNLQKAYDEAVARKKRLQFNFYAKQIAMIHSELTELLEVLRKDKGIKEAELECGDIFIRLADLYQGLKADGFVELAFIDAIMYKANKNLSRDRLHGVNG